MKLLILAPYPAEQAPSQRFRFEQYLPDIKKAGMEVTYHTFWSNRQWSKMYEPGHILLKFTGMLSGFLRRIMLLFRIGSFDKVFVHREATPIGPPFIEWIISKVWRKKLIFDFDDAIWMSNNSTANAKLVSSLKNPGKTAKIISWSEKVFAGNNYLASYARNFNSNVEVIPTTIDNLKVHNRVKKHLDKAEPIIGWTGTHSTLRQLNPIWPLLVELYRKRPFKFLVISDQPPNFKAEFLEYIPWNKSSEIETLLKFDIGIMPLYDDEWEKGKCGFKALQYMALGIPPVASSVGVNTEIINDGINGFLIPPDKPELWINRLIQLLDDSVLRTKTGANARQKIVENYSVEAYSEIVVKQLMT